MKTIQKITREQLQYMAMPVVLDFMKGQSQVSWENINTMLIGHNSIFCELRGVLTRISDLRENDIYWIMQTMEKAGLIERKTGLGGSRSGEVNYSAVYVITSLGCQGMSPIQIKDHYVASNNIKAKEYHKSIGLNIWF